MKPVFLFDMDGTLIDASPAIYESSIVAARSVNAPIPSRVDVEGVIGLPLFDMFRALRVPESDVESAISSYRTHFRKIGTDSTTLLPGAAEAVRLARSMGRTAVVTTKTGWYTRELIVHLGIGQYLETVVGFEDVSRPKPDAEPIHRALQWLNIDVNSPHFDSSNVWMIGDTAMDEGAARAAGVNCAMVPGFGSELKECGQDAVSPDDTKFQSNRSESNSRLPDRTIHAEDVSLAVKRIIDESEKRSVESPVNGMKAGS